MKYVLFVLGLIAVVFGVAIYGWVIYNLVWPTPEFKANVNGTIGQFIFPGAMIFFGIRWMLRIRRPTVEAVAPGEPAKGT